MIEEINNNKTGNMLYWVKSAFNVVVFGVSVFALVQVVSFMNTTNALKLETAPKALLNL
jgi:hypothetical protein